MKRIKSFKEDDQVFAKIKGYPPWPAKVVGKSGKKFKVQFYGTGETGFVRPEDIFYFIKNKEQMMKGSKKKEFKDAVEEIEKVIAENGGFDGDQGEDESVPPAKRKRSNSEKSSDSSVKKDGKNSESEGDGESNLSAPFTEGLNTLKEEPHSEREEAESPDTRTDPINLDVDDDIPLLENNIKIVSENNLKNWLTYANTVKDNPDLYKARRVDQRLYFENQAFPVLLPSGQYAGIKLHKTWPLNFANEFECAMYDDATAVRVLKLKELVNSGAVTVDTDPDIFLPNFNLTSAEIKRDAEMKRLNNKYKRVERLRNESALVELDAKIKNCLGLIKADPEPALELLDQMMQIEIDELMLKKHAHVVEMIRRLRKYIGNIEEWNFSADELETFNNYARRIRLKSDEVYKKLKSAVQLPAGSVNFWDGFNDIVRKFREDCHHLNNREVFVLCAEAYSRQAIMERLEQEEELTEAEIGNTGEKPPGEEVEEVRVVAEEQ